MENQKIDQKKKRDGFGLDKLAYMLQFLKGHLVLYWLGTLMIASFGFLLNVFSGQLYRVITGLADDWVRFWRELGLVFVLLLVIVILVGAGNWLFTSAVAYGDQALRKKLSFQMSRMSMADWYSRHSGEWLTMLGKDADNAARSYKQVIVNAAGLAIQLVGGILVVLKAPWLLLYALVSGFAYFGIGIIQRKRYKKYAEGEQQAAADAASYIEDVLNGFIVMRLYHLLKLLMERHEEAVKEGREYGWKIAKVSILNGALGQIGYTLGFSGVYLVGLLLVNQGQMSVPEMLAIWPIAMGVSNSISHGGFFLTSIQPTVVAIERVMGALELQIEQDGRLSQVEERDDGIALELRDVCFGYEENKPVLDHVSLQIRKGEKIAIVGESGCGKSTLVKLLLRFYDVQQGEIRLGKHLVADYTLSALRGQFAYVQQNARLLGGTIFQNISMVREEATQEQVYEAARNAYADEFIRELPEGYETQVGERGAQVSGGQRQRIAIARAFLKDAPIMIFDEITASLDSESEAKVQQAVDATPQEKTLIMITHRLSAAVSADCILVMDKGRLVESGSHSELLAQGGVYTRLWNTQFS